MTAHTVSTKVWLDGAYEDLPVYVRDGIKATRGAGAEGQEAPPSTLALTVDNSTREWSPTNPAGLVYGAAGRNTPLQVTLDGVVRSTVEASSWAPRESMGGHDAWVPIRGGGIMRRLQQGKTPLQAPLERAIRAAGPVAYWPVNEPDTATSFASGLPGGPSFTLGGVLPGVVPGPAGTVGSFPNVVPVDGASVWATVPAPAGLSTAGWGFECIVYIGGLVDPGGSTTSTLLLSFDLIGATEPWALGVGIDSGPEPFILMLGRVGASNASVGVFDGLALGWHHVRVTAEDVGADVEITMYVDGQVLGASATRTIAGVSLGVPTGTLMIGKQTPPDVFDENVEASSVGMVAFYDLAGAGDHSAAAVGHTGELAGVRFLRVGGEEGITVTVQGDELETQPMGPQPVDTTMGILRECVRTDAGMLVEPVDGIGLEMITGRSLVNQDPVLTIDFTEPGVADGFMPLLDDKPTRNWIVVKNRSGGEAVAVQTVGPLNVNDPFTDPDGVGKVDHQVDVNVADPGLLYAHAGWHLGLGTCVDPRWPQLVIDLDDAPTLTAGVDAVRIGQVITVENLPEDWAQEPVRLLVVGMEDEMPSGAGHKRRLVRFVGVPAAPYEVGIVGAADGSVDVRGGRVDTRLSTLDGAHTSSGTALSIDSGGMPWTTDADHWDTGLHGGGLFLNLRGEKVRVTNVTGAGSAWTVTVVRSVNGVVLSHQSGTPVRMWTPIRVGL